MALKVAIDLHSEKRAKVLEVIDKLRELGISDSVSLPQLVVVGDQSSGKSSLLEGLTGLSFPVSSDLCTRFVTQIVLRRAPQKEAGAKITIIPGPSSQLDRALQKKLKRFKRVLRADEFGREEFGRVFNEAAEIMGVPGPNTTDLENIDKRFADDILKIELSGPEHHHLSVVDSPGLFHNPTKYQTEEDKSIIRGLIKKYITDKRTIILAVMDARNNLANQGVFAMERAADPAGKRTVGIITKCDAVEEGDEAGVIRIAKNQVEKLTHGWFAVRNRSTKDIEGGMTIEGRHLKEKEFFSGTAPWTELRKDRVGIHSLMTFLGDLLYEHIRNEFPNVVKDIEVSLSAAKSELDLLGPSRQTAIEQRRFLNHIANLYQSEVDDALNGNYNPELSEQSPLKLRMHVRALNDDFSLKITKHGHARVFCTPGDDEDPEFQCPHERSDNGGLEQPVEESIYSWIRRLYRDSRGTELPGTVNPRVLQNIFRQQSAPWKDIALAHIDKVNEAVKAYNEQVFSNIILDGDVRHKLAMRVMSAQYKAHTRAKTEFARILKDERGGILQTVNHYYADTLNAIRDERVRARLKQMGLDKNAVVQFNIAYYMQIVHLSNEDQAVNDIHDILKAYYKVALKRFADNVIIQIVERCILGQDGPLGALCLDMVNDLDEGELFDIAGENFMTSSLRNELLDKCGRLQQAFEIAKQAGI
ncbi:P-loop containing nucleoside triphosphate hydrolase protein [Aspergillus spinulosporus]